MRKKAISIAILLPLLLLCGVLCMVYTRNTVHAFTPLIETAQAHALRREWAEAERWVDSAEALFLEREQLLRLFTAHAAVESVLHELCQVRTGLRLADETIVFPHFITLTFAAKNLDQYDDISIANII